MDETPVPANRWQRLLEWLHRYRFLLAPLSFGAHASIEAILDALTSAVVPAAGCAEAGVCCHAGTARRAGHARDIGGSVKLWAARLVRLLGPREAIGRRFGATKKRVIEVGL